MANTGYFIGIGIEAFVILLCVVLLALMFTGVLFRVLSKMSEDRAVRAEARAAAAEAKAIADEEAAAQAAAEAAAEAERYEAEQAALREKRAAEEAAKKAAAEAEAAARAAEEAEAAELEKTTEKEVVKERIIEKVVIVEQQKAEEPAVVEQPLIAEAAVADATEEEAEGENEFVVVHDGIVFNDSKTITELYEELSAEQQSYFDELREEALTKPDAELAIAKNFVTVKIGKRNLIKLLIKRGVTVAEFMLENDALKQLRLSNTNKRGKSAIKIKPTVVQVLDLASLKVAVDMINLSYEDIMMD